MHSCLRFILNTFVAIFVSVFIFGFSTNTNASANVTTSQEQTVFTWDNATVYFVMTDRFYDGNKANNHAYGREHDLHGKAIKGFDSKPGRFMGGDLKGLTIKLNEGYFTKLGVNAIWITSPIEQIHGWIAGPGFRHYGYHGYYAQDFTELDDNMGTAAELREFIDTAHSKGIRVIFDVVMNHVGYPDLWSMREYDFGQPKTGWVDYYFNRPEALVDYETYRPFFDANSASRWAKWWGPDWIRADLPGHDACGSNDDYTRCLGGLYDLKTESKKEVAIPPFLLNKWGADKEKRELQKLNGYFERTGKPRTVRNHLIQWLTEWVREYGVDGFRIDTAIHVEMDAWRDLKEQAVEALREWKAKHPHKKVDDLDFWMVAETWGHTVHKDTFFTEGGFDSVINFEFNLVPKHMERLEQVYERYARTINTDAGFNVLSYISSHDTSMYDRNDLLNGGTALLLAPGGVQIYYGDESARPLDQSPADQPLRTKMNWSSMNKNVLNHWQKLGQFRQRHVAVGAGVHRKLQTQPYVFSRSFHRANLVDEVVVALGVTGKATLNVGSVFKNGVSVRDFYTGNLAVVTNGKVTFTAQQNGVLLLEHADASSLRADLPALTPFSVTNEKPKGLTIHFKKPKEFGTPQLFYYETTPSDVLQTVWPTAPTMSREMDNWYVYTIPDVTSARVFFKDNIGNQIPNVNNAGVLVSGERWFDGTQWLTSAPFVFQDTIAPSVPLNVQAKERSQQSITLAWAPPTDNVGVTSYRIQRNGVMIATTVKPGFFDTKLNPSTWYQYRIQAIDGSGNESMLSPIYRFRTASAAVTPLPTPNRLDVLERAGTMIRLSWHATDDPRVSSYEVYRNEQKVALVTQPQYTETNVSANQQYTYRVAIIGKSGTKSPKSNAITVNAPLSNSKILAPQHVVVTAKSGTSIRIVWQPVNNASRYIIYRNSMRIAVVPMSKTPSFTDSTVQPGIFYTYTVQAQDASGKYSALSNRITLQTGTSSQVAKPLPPQSLVLGAVADNSVSLQWKASQAAGGVSAYQVYRDQKLIATVSGSSGDAEQTVRPLFVDRSVATNRNYSYAVRAIDDSGNISILSASLSVNTLPVMLNKMQVLEPRSGMMLNDYLQVRATVASTSAERLDVYYAVGDEPFTKNPTATQMVNGSAPINGSHTFFLSMNMTTRQDHDNGKLMLVARDRTGKSIASQIIDGLQKRRVAATLKSFATASQSIGVYRDGSHVIRDAKGNVAGARFVLWSKYATKAQVWIYGYADNASGVPYKVLELVKQPGDVLNGSQWIADALHDRGFEYRAGLLYGLRVWGPNFEYHSNWRPGSLAGFKADVDVSGNRYNPNKLLIDPYARTINKDPNMKLTAFLSGVDGRKIDSAGPAPKSIVYDPALYAWGNDKKPTIAARDRIVYEVHVRGYTQDPSSGVLNPGTYKGFGQKLNHLTDLGVNAIEFLPVHEFISDEEEVYGPNYWGYMTLNYFAPDRRYASDKSPFGAVHEFRDLVKQMHTAGKEVILDVVYNHTAEGGTLDGDPNKSSILSLRGIDNQSYYSLSKDRQSFQDNTGCCGANVNVVSAKGQQFIIDSLRYWLEDMRVDGFRFDLSSILGNKMEHGGFEYTRDGLLTRIYKEFPQAVLIAEPWAIGDGHYQVGNHPGSIVQGDNAWSEWNDKYRTTIRQAVKGDSGVVRDLATRIAGSSDLYEDDERRPFNSINYVVSHDGYTLHDLVSFNSNDSWDSGGDEAVRRKQMRNFFTHLLLSAGTPMILGGDEMSRTQHGNAGAYNQDNLVSWYDWNDMSRNRGMYQFVKTLVHLRNNHPVLKRMDFFNGADNNGDGVQNIEWHGTVYKQPDWAPTSRVLAWRLDGSTVETKAPADNDFYVMANHSHLQLLFHLPPNRPGKRWYRLLDTGVWAESFVSLNDNIDQPGQEDVVSDGTWTDLQASKFAQNGSYTYKLGDKSMAVFIEK